MEKAKIHRNSHDGLQIEWQGVLLTLRLNNKDHGVFGSLASKEGDVLHLVEFHGLTPVPMLPVEIHQTKTQTQTQTDQFEG